MNHVPILLEHIHLFNRLNGLDVEFLERGLEFFVVGARGFVDFLHLSARGAFAAGYWYVSLEGGGLHKGFGSYVVGGICGEGASAVYS